MAAMGRIPAGHQLPTIAHDYLEHLRLRGGARTTLTVYRNTLRRLDWWLQTHRGTTLAGASAEDLYAWRLSLTIANSSIVTYGTTVQCFYYWAFKRGSFYADVAEDLPLPRRRPRIPRPIAEDPLEFAIACAPERIRPWLILAAYAGLRCCEIARLRREDVLDTARPRVLMVTGKGDKDRVVAMSPTVWAGIRDGLPARGWLYLRQDGQGGPNSAATLSKIGNRHLRACGLPETMHQLRHRFATVGLAETKDLRAVQELLGHASPATTAGYAQLSNAAAVAVVLAAQPKRRPGRPRRYQPDPA